jgi:uncharacterized protein with HEPN domain
MSNRTPELLIEDVLDSIHKINQYISGLNDREFVGDNKTVDAVIRNFEIIGEASGRLPPDFKLKYSNVDWEKMRGFRNRIVHDYFGIDYEIVWNIIKDTLPTFENSIQIILEEIKKQQNK